MLRFQTKINKDKYLFPLMTIENLFPSDKREWIFIYILNL